MVVCSSMLHCEYRQDLQFLDLPVASEILPLSVGGTVAASWAICDSIILLKLCWFLMAEERLSILLLMFSNILSLEASFLDKFSIILAWLEINSLKDGWLEIIEIITLRVTLVVWPLLLIPSLILLRMKVVVVDEVYILIDFRAAVPWMPSISTLFTRYAEIMIVHDFLLLIGRSSSFFISRSILADNMSNSLSWCIPPPLLWV